MMIALPYCCRRNIDFNGLSSAYSLSVATTLLVLGVSASHVTGPDTWLMSHQKRLCNIFVVYGVILSTLGTMLLIVGLCEAFARTCLK